jgi:predicted nucleotidyltransferase
MKTVPKAPPDLHRIREMVGPLCERHSVARMEVFGSVAAGTAREDSDVDFLVEFLPGTLPGLLEMGGLKEDLEERLGRPVDLLSRTAVEHSRNPFRRRSILACPVTVYALLPHN